MKQKYHDLREAKEFFRMCISYSYKDQRIFIDKSEYLNKVLACFNIVTNLISTLLLLGYVFKSNDKQCNSNFHQKYQQIVRSLIYLMIGSCSEQDLLQSNLPNRQQISQMSIIEQDYIFVDICLILTSIRQSIMNSAMSLLQYILIQTGHKIQNYINL